MSWGGLGEVLGIVSGTSGTVGYCKWGRLDKLISERISISWYVS